MRLSTYLKIQKKKGITTSAWARRHKISPAVISRYLHGRGMSGMNALKIESATNGKVDALTILKAIGNNHRR